MKHKLLILSLIFSSTSVLNAQYDNSKLTLGLDDVIRLANDSSLQAFIVQNTYLASYWDFRNFNSTKLPFLNFNGSPVDFTRKYSQEYNFLDSSYYYVEQQTFGASGNFSLNQTIMKTGGRLYLDTDLGYLNNLNQTAGSQFYSTPLRIGFSQQLFGYNAYQWLNKIAPVEFETAKKQLLEDMENISLLAVHSFFTLSSAQTNLEIAETILANADTLYRISMKRFELTSISQEDLYTLKLSWVNSKNNYEQAKIDLKRAQMQLNSLLRLDNSVNIELILPDELPDLHIDPDKCLEMAMQNNPEIFEYKSSRLQAERDVEQARKDSRMAANMNASFGLNQQGSSINSAYRNPTDQEVVSVGISVPILDWGQSKSAFKLAQKRQEIVNANLEQSEIDFRQTVLLTAEEFNLQKQLVAGAIEADSIAWIAYEITRARYLNGQSDIIKMGSYLKSSIDAKQAYIQALENYWTYYYTIRKLSLYDFEKGKAIEEDLDEIVNK